MEKDEVTRRLVNLHNEMTMRYGGDLNKEQMITMAEAFVFWFPELKEGHHLKSMGFRDGLGVDANERCSGIVFSKNEWGWLTGGDTGLSSLTIFEGMTGINLGPGILAHYTTPADPSDFGRCYRLLRIFPEWEDRLVELSRLNPMWRIYSEFWKELSELYEIEILNVSGNAPRLFKRMRDIDTEYYGGEFRH